MTTLDQAFEAAIDLLRQRGQLLNAHLFRLVNADEDLYRQVRNRLILEGVAEDRSGVGLVRTDRTPNASSAKSDATGEFACVDEEIGSPDEESRPSDSETAEIELVADWWLMAAGVVRGPVDLATLCRMRQSSELRSADVVRQGVNGLWQSPDEIPELAAARPRENRDSPRSGFNQQRRNDWRALPWTKSHYSSSVPDADKSSADGFATAAPLSGSPATDGPGPESNDFDSTVEQGNGLAEQPDSSTSKNRFVFPEKSWSVGDHKRPGWMANRWRSVAAMVGGPKRLWGLVLSAAAIFLVMTWWQQPPPASTVYREFTNCRTALKRMQERRVGRAEWDLVTTRYRPRIGSIVDRLRSRSSDRYPLERALYLAGQEGLMPMLNNPITYFGSEQIFENQMEIARKLLGDAASP